MPIVNNILRSIKNTLYDMSDRVYNPDAYHAKNANSHLTATPKKPFFTQEDIDLATHFRDVLGTSQKQKPTPYSSQQSPQQTSSNTPTSFLNNSDHNTTKRF
mgnify:CR=1 FL=1